MQNAPPQRYSTLFSTLYDEPAPVGTLGRGAHYSVLRCAEWLNVVREPLQHPQIHDFAVIWDEDHDTRVIQVAEQLYVEGLLSPVQFIGERKASLTVVVAAKFYFHGSEKVIQNYESRIIQIVEDLAFDTWNAEVGMFDRSPGSPHQNDARAIIAAEEHRVQTYLSNIDSLWALGTKPYKPSPCCEAES
ncbi:hypothetical protein SSPSH_003696 [Salinisphaera shabanensis E1L3A]|uniref:Uncharacterized protein n=1 Tax=Salinisphaera shabanensis E1L3A TaxID=1033802 RepID=U2FMN4_9GAMM|nr:hypothetical protein [Salinisphaera shabanensis]ERJ17484.1 hypothetical protein SSPSH_003696 [Salinisphaera shabanensis E1L3A]